MKDLIKTGAIVCLKSGSPLMVVSNVTDKHAKCLYFNTDLQTIEPVELPVELLTVSRPADEDIKNGVPIPVSRTSIFLSFDTAEEAQEFINTISDEDGPEAEYTTSTIKH